jgi:hypothetical protein
MIKQALEYLIGLGKTEIIQVGEHKFATNTLKKIDEPLVREPFNITTLTGIVDYIKEGIDCNVIGPEMTIHIESPTSISIYSELAKDKFREQLVQARAIVPKIPFDQFFDVESFNILLQSCFEVNGDRSKVLTIVGTVKEENVRTTGDDGISQMVTAKVGIASFDDVKVPNPVSLKPYRTFPEIEQPESKFVFRMQDGPRAALFEAGGTGWRVEAMLSIKEYLKEKLQGHSVNIIL